MALFNLRKKDGNEAKIPANIMLRVKPHDHTDEELFVKGFSMWKKSLDAQDLSMLYFDDINEDDTQLYLSLRTTQSLFSFYKKLVIQGMRVPDSDGDVFEEIALDISIQQNNFAVDKDGQVSFSKNNKPLVEDVVEIREYKNVLLNTHFYHILYTLSQWIFYSYSNNEILNDKNLETTYKDNSDLAETLVDNYRQETPDAKDKELPVLPTFKDFEEQNEAGLYIPAFREHEKQAEIAKEKAAKEKAAKAKEVKEVAHSRNADVDERPTEKSSNAKSQDPYAKKKEKKVTVSKTKDPYAKKTTNKKGSKNSDDKKNQEKFEIANLPESIQKIANLPLDVTEKQIANAVRAMVDSGSFVQKQPVKFQKFDIDDSVGKVPDDISEAIKNGNFDNQRYVQQMTNEFKRTANELIGNREKELNLAFRRSLIDMYSNAYEKINKEYARAFAENTNDKPLEESARQYYDEKFNEQQKRFILDKNAEIDNAKEHLRKEMDTKLQNAINIADKRYRERLRTFQEDLSTDSVTLFNDSRKKRNDELTQQMDRARQEAMKQLDLEIENHTIEFQHKAASGSQMIFTFFNKQLDKSRDQWISDVANLINKQIQLNKANEQLRRAEFDAANATDNEQKREEQEKVVDNYRKRTADLQNEINRLNKNLMNEQQKSNSVAADNEQFNTMIANLKNQLENSNRIKDKTNQELADLNNKYIQIQNEYEKVKRERDRIASEQSMSSDNNNQEMSRLKNELNNAKSDSEKVRLENESLKRQLANFKSDKNAADIEREQAAERERIEFQQREKEALRQKQIAEDEAARKEAEAARERNNKALYEASKKPVQPMQPMQPTNISYDNYQHLSASEKSRMIENENNRRQLQSLQAQIDAQNRLNQNNKKKHFWNK